MLARAEQSYSERNVSWVVASRFSWSRSRATHQSQDDEQVIPPGGPEDDDARVEAEARAKPCYYLSPRTECQRCLSTAFWCRLPWPCRHRGGIGEKARRPRRTFNGLFAYHEGDDDGLRVGRTAEERCLVEVGRRLPVLSADEQHAALTTPAAGTMPLLFGAGSDGVPCTRIGSQAGQDKTHSIISSLGILPL